MWVVHQGQPLQKRDWDESLLEGIDPIVELDTETTGLVYPKDQVLLLQLGVRIKGVKRAYVFDSREVPDSVLNILSGTSHLKLLAGALFDYRMIYSSYGLRLKNFSDVILLEKVAKNGMYKENSLAAIVNRRLGIYMSKEEQTSFNKQTNRVFREAQIIYAANDVLNLRDIYEQQLAEIKENNLLYIKELEEANLEINCEMSARGVRIDLDSWTSLAKENERNLKSCDQKADEIFYSSPELKDLAYYEENQLSLFEGTTRKIKINWGSPQQVLPIINKTTPFDVANTASDTIKAIAPYHALNAAINERNSYKKLAQAYGMRYLREFAHGGFVYPSIKNIVRTGREAYSEPNLQQVPRDDRFRECFMPPDPNHVFVFADYSSQELCCIAHLAQDPVWLQTLKEGKDIHSKCAHLLFKEKWEEAGEENCLYESEGQKCSCKKHGFLRNAAKSLNFGLAYGMGAQSLAERLDIPLLEADDLMNEFFSVFPKIKACLDELAKFGLDNGFAMTPKGRIRYFPTWKGEYTAFGDRGSIVRESMNMPIQGMGADMIKAAKIRIHERLKKENLDAYLCLTVHDETGTSCHREIAPYVARLVQEEMEEAANEVIPGYLCKAEPSILERWKKD